MKIQKVVIVGAGAMGAAYAAMFTDSQGFAVSFVAKGERFKRLQAQPLTVNGKPYQVPVVVPDDDIDPADLILVALKHHHLQAALPDIKPFVGTDTVILSVMNGLESEEMIGAVCGMDKMVFAIAVGIDAVREANRFTYASPGRIVFGEIPPRQSPRLARVQEALEHAGIPNEVAPDILRILWWKFMINVGVNQASAVLRAPYGIFQTTAEAAGLMKSLMLEVVELAQKAGIELTPKDLEAWHQVLVTLSPDGKTSMLQDIEAGRKTEVEIFAGKVVALGRQYGVPTPVNETIMRIIKVVEDGTGAPSSIKPYDYLSMDWYR